MTTIILKVQLRDEIRRVSLNVADKMEITELEAKVVHMFPQLQDFIMMMRNPSTEDLQPIFTNSQLETILSLVRAVRPPILRITVLEGQKRPEVDAAELVSGAEPSLSRAEVRVLSADEEEEVEEEGDDEGEEEIEEEEDEEIEEGEDATPATLSSSEDETEPANEPDSICSNCKSYIGEESCFEKARYKCINCVDVLCDYCEENQLHDPSHLLVKLRVPVDQLPLKQQIVFVSHIEDPTLRNDARIKRKELRTALKAERRERRKQERLNAKKEKKLARRAERKQARLARKQKELDKKLAVAMIEAQAQLEEFAIVAQTLAEAVECPEEALPQAEVEDIPALVEAETSLPEPTYEEMPQLVNGMEVEVLQEEIVEEEEIPQEELEFDEEDWSEELTDGFEVVFPKEVTPLEITGTPQVDLSAHRIAGLAFREKLDAMEKMGFGDRSKNIFLLVKHLASLEGAVAELVASRS